MATGVHDLGVNYVVVMGLFIRFFLDKIFFNYFVCHSLMTRPYSLHFTAAFFRLWWKFLAFFLRFELFLNSVLGMGFIGVAMSTIYLVYLLYLQPSTAVFLNECDSCRAIRDLRRSNLLIYHVFLIPCAHQLLKWLWPSTSSFIRYPLWIDISHWEI